MSDEDVWCIIKELFFWEWSNLKWLNKAYFDIIKCDLDNLEKTATNWMKGASFWAKGGRPKKEETPQGLLQETPQGLEKKPLNERERERESIKEYKEKYFLNNSISQDLILECLENKKITDIQTADDILKLRESIKTIFVNSKQNKDFCKKEKESIIIWLLEWNWKNKKYSIRWFKQFILKWAERWTSSTK